MTIQYRKDPNTGAPIIEGDSANDSIHIAPVTDAEGKPTGELSVYAHTGGSEPSLTLYIEAEAAQKGLQVHGGGGDDYLVVSPACATGVALYGEAGNDLIRGGGGNDYIEGGTGDDILEGKGGDDLVAGGLGADQIYGGTGKNTLIGDEPRQPEETASDSFFVAGEDTILDRECQDWAFGE